MTIGTMTFRSKSYLDSAKGQSCVNCGRKDGTVVAAHYQGLRAHAFGKGKGIKPSDLMTAHLCSRCHKDADSYEWSNLPDKTLRQIDVSEAFMYLILKTIERNIEQGVLEVKK